MMNYKNGKDNNLDSRMTIITWINTNMLVHIKNYQYFVDNEEYKILNNENKITIMKSNKIVF